MHWMFYAMGIPLIGILWMMSVIMALILVKEYQDYRKR